MANYGVVSPGQQSMSNMRTAARMSPTLSSEMSCDRQAPDKQLAIICSEKQARVSVCPLVSTSDDVNVLSVWPNQSVG